ncbi:MAG: hypothetical protein HC905_02740 [Bacteroidales bacterium]|nr:hypothetical protein [Bacteroidales bacterium]
MPANFTGEYFGHSPIITCNCRVSRASKKRKYLNGRINYTLDLSAPYETLVKDYKENTQRNIEKSQKHNCSIKDCGVAEFLEFSNSHLEGLNSYNFQIFSRLIAETSERKLARIEKAVDANGEILSVACFLVWNMRIFYLAGASSPKGKQVSSMFLVFDKLIRDFASTGYLIDFEGSMIPGVARFFSGFGAKSFYYYHLKKYLFFYR